MPIQVYYAHAMCTYDTNIEQEELAIIRRHLPGHEIVNPGTYQENTEKSQQGMKYCFGLIDGCSALAFSRLLTRVTAGVGLEVNYALNRNLPVYEIANGALNKTNRQVRYLSREDSIRLYETWRTLTGRAKSNPFTGE